MRILWVTNIPIGKQCEITTSRPVIGGWLMAALEKLIGDSSLEVCVATTWAIAEKTSIIEDNVEYLVLPGGYPIRFNDRKKRNYRFWEQLIQQFRPDVIHIHGTEFPLGLALMKACPEENYIISIQGLLSVYERYYFAGIPFTEMRNSITIGDILRRDTLFQGRRQFRKRGVQEIEYIKSTSHVIGRTNWDYAHVVAINPAVRYHFCNESLRAPFYQADWAVASMKRHSLFVSQGDYPIKGLHMLLKAIHLLKKDFEGIRLTVAGQDITKGRVKGPGGWQPGYWKYIRSMICKYNLEENVRFTGFLTAEEMVSQLRSAHLFVCPSSIENSPNSLGEAQVVGTPCIAAYTGGIPDMVDHGETGFLYPFEEYEVLATYIRRIFENDELANRLSLQARLSARKRHHGDINGERLMEIYRTVADVG